MIRTTLIKEYTLWCEDLSHIRNVISKWFTKITSISLTNILIRLIYGIFVCWWYVNYKLKPFYRLIRRLKRKTKKMIRWTWNKITIILNPISILLYSLTDYRWLTFYIIVLAKLFNDLCEREDEREYYENYYEDDKENSKNGDEEDNGDRNDDQT
ncbi:hypothetical protein [Candidatus Hodgkinia cicadicola]|uniref:hypothetical protein n=1 Tax=Candidatus Hodgkinia cicadicola TaxID=573658 RepID=UPI0011BA618A